MKTYNPKTIGAQFLVGFDRWIFLPVILGDRPLALARRPLIIHLYQLDHAAKGGAVSTTTIDMSKTYLEWAERNLELNGFKAGDQHKMLQADCLAWLRQQRREFDLIFLDR